MNKPHKNKPFPLSIFEWKRLKTRHIFCFWSLCNDFECDESGWIRITRKQFNKVIPGFIPVAIHNPTLMLEMLSELGYIEFVREHVEVGWRSSTTDAYAIRVCPTAWDPIEVVNPVYKQTIDQIEDKKAFYRDRYARKKAALDEARKAEEERLAKAYPIKGLWTLNDSV